MTKKHKKHPYLWTVIVIGLVLECYSVLPQKRESNFTSGNTPKTLSYVQGIIHVHSSFSDGGGTPEQIAQAAEQAGMDFVVLTDHNNYEARKKGFEKKWGNTDLFVEMEASTLVGHAVSFFSQNEALKNADSETIVQATYKQFLKKEQFPGLFLAVAHPSNIKNPWSRLDEFAEGLEVVNFDSSWQRQLADNPLDFFLTVSLYPFNNYLSALRFFEIYPKDFAAWDAMSALGPGHFAYLAHDAHSKVKLNRDRYLNWPGYLQTFKLASNVLFLKEPKAADFESRKKQIYQSLREGRLAIVYQSVAPFEGNHWNIQCGQESFVSGDVVKNGTQCRARVATPETSFPKIIRLIKNGEMISETEVEGNSTAVQVLPLKGAGAYRVEVFAKRHTLMRVALNRLVPYVFYSPIFVQ
jgi:PHP domain